MRHSDVQERLVPGPRLREVQKEQRQKMTHVSEGHAPRRRLDAEVVVPEHHGDEQAAMCQLIVRERVSSLEGDKELEEVDGENAPVPWPDDEDLGRVRDERDQADCANDPVVSCRKILQLTKRSWTSPW